MQQKLKVNWLIFFDNSCELLIVSLRKKSTPFDNYCLD